LASSRSTSNGPDWQDVAATLQAFEAINRVSLTVRMSAELGKGGLDLLLTASADGIEAGEQEAKCLASASVRCSKQGYRSLEAGILQLIYRLDGMLAQGEFARTLAG